MSIYDLIEVNIGGSVVQARPIDWSTAPTGNSSDDEITVTQYMTTCPLCAQLLKFGPQDINGSIVMCSCIKQEPINNDAEVIKINTTEINQQEIDNIIKREKDLQFVDPIAEKYINTDNYVL